MSRRSERKSLRGFRRKSPPRDHRERRKTTGSLPQPRSAMDQAMRSEDSITSTFQEQPLLAHPALSSFYIINTLTGDRIYPNSKTPIHLSTEWFEMDMLLLVRTPDVDDKNDSNGAPFNQKWVDYLSGRQRRFEFQYQMKLKKIPQGKSIYFCGEVDEPIKMGPIQRALVGAVMAFMKSTNPGCHFSISGSKHRTPDGKYEKPHLAFTVERSLDRLVVTKPGDTPPKLGTTIQEDPKSMKRRKKGKRIDWNIEDTYTMALWTSYIDLIDWRVLNIPGVRPFTLGSVLGPQAVSLGLYMVDEKRDTDKHYVKDITNVVRLELSNEQHAEKGQYARRWKKGNSKVNDIEGNPSSKSKKKAKRKSGVDANTAKCIDKPETATATAAIVDETAAMKEPKAAPEPVEKISEESEDREKPATEGAAVEVLETFETNPEEAEATCTEETPATVEAAAVNQTEKVLASDEGATAVPAAGEINPEEIDASLATVADEVGPTKKEAHGTLEADETIPEEPHISSTTTGEAAIVADQETAPEAREPTFLSSTTDDKPDAGEAPGAFASMEAVKTETEEDAAAPSEIEAEALNVSSMVEEPVDAPIKGEDDAGVATIDESAATEDATDVAIGEAGASGEAILEAETAAGDQPVAVEEPAEAEAEPEREHVKGLRHSILHYFAGDRPVAVEEPAEAETEPEREHVKGLRHSILHYFAGDWPAAVKEPAEAEAEPEREHAKGLRHSLLRYAGLVGSDEEPDSETTGATSTEEEPQFWRIVVPEEFLEEKVEQPSWAMDDDGTTSEPEEDREGADDCLDGDSYGASAETKSYSLTTI